MSASRGRITVILLAQIALGLLAMTAPLPSMPSWQQTFDASQAHVQLSFSAYLVAFALAQLVYGPLSDNYGRRRILLIGLGIGLAGTLAAIAAPTLDWLIAARALQGAGMCAGMAIGRAMIQDIFLGPERTRIMAWAGVTMGFCPPLGTVVGGSLHAWFGWQFVFVALAVVSVLCMAAAASGLPGQTPRTAPRRTVRQMVASYGELLATPAYLPYCLIAAFTSGCFYVFIGSAPLVFDSYGVAPEHIGWYIMMVPASYITGNLIVTRVTGRVAESTLMLTGQMCNLVGIGLVPVLALTGIAHPLAVSMPLMLMGLGNGLLMPPTLTGAVGALPLLAGAAAAMAGMLQQMIGAAASFISGLLDMGDASAMGLLMVALTTLAFLAQLPLMVQRSRTRPAL